VDGKLKKYIVDFSNINGSHFIVYPLIFVRKKSNMSLKGGKK
jgi:hypothetical protein